MTILTTLIAIAMPMTAMSQAGYPVTFNPKKTPAEVTDLYLTMVVLNDVVSACELNDYTRPALGGKDWLDLAMVAKMHDAIVTKSIEAFTPVFGKERAEALAGALVTDTERSACHAVNNEPAPSPTAPGGLATTSTYQTVHYHCEVANVARIAADVMAERKRNPSKADDADGMVAELIVRLRQASIDLPFDGELLLTRSRNPQTGQDIWTASPGDLYDRLSKATSFGAPDDAGSPEMIPPEPQH